MRYRDRTEAGERLAESLGRLVIPAPIVVLGIPRGGVPVAAVVARLLGAPLDILLTHKLGAPGNPEFAFGAVADTGATIVDAGIVAALRIPQAYIDEEIARQSEALAARAAALSEVRPGLQLAGSGVVVVDDGIATGATLEVAVRVARAGGAAAVVAATPVGPADSVERIGVVADRVVCPLQPDGFVAVGAWYEDFAQVTEAEVRALLAAPG